MKTRRRSSVQGTCGRLRDLLPVQSQGHSQEHHGASVSADHGDQRAVTAGGALTVSGHDASQRKAVQLLPKGCGEL